ncbi:12492_t:CDS:2, partial [Rhizophagus irregularis]
LMATLLDPRYKELGLELEDKKIEIIQKLRDEFNELNSNNSNNTTPIAPIAEPSNPIIPFSDAESSNRIRSLTGTTLVTDPIEIKKLTNNHFQLCPGAVNQDKPIPDQWKNQYNPLSHIDQDIYNNIMDLPFWDEWVQSASYKDNIYDLQSNIINQHILSMAYMDNTQWLSESKDNLEKILEIADDFYNFTDIQVNKQKSELLLRIQNPNFKYNDDIQLNFENQQIAIKPVHQSQSVRILGVWFNMNCSQRYVIDQIKEEILKLALCMKYKRLTDKQITTLDGKSLINWKDLKFRPYSQSMALALFLPAHNFKGILVTHPSFENNIKG